MFHIYTWSMRIKIPKACQVIICLSLDLNEFLMFQIFLFKLHARYLAKYFFKYDIRLENHLLIRMIAVTLRNLHTAGISRSQAVFS